MGFFGEKYAIFDIFLKKPQNIVVHSMKFVL